MRWWLIRHPDHTFSRPIDEASLIARIEAGELAQKDEICASEGYWFSIQDAMEVRKFLGDVKIQRNVPNDSETSTTIQSNAKTVLNPVPDGKTGIRQDASQVPAQRSRAVPQPVDPAKGGFSFEVDDEHSGDSSWIRYALVLVISLIFLGTLFLFWTHLKNKRLGDPGKKYQKSMRIQRGGLPIGLSGVDSFSRAREVCWNEALASRPVFQPKRKELFL